MNLQRLKPELPWIAPLAFLALVSLMLLRPWPTIPLPDKGRVIVDAAGKKVVIPEPSPGVIGGSYLDDFLLKTHAPEAILKAGGPRDRPLLDPLRDPVSYPLLFRIYPQIAQNDALWDFPGNLESILAQDVGGVHLGGGERFEELGLITVSAHPPDTHDKDTVIATQIRVWNRVIGGEAERRGAAILGRYQRDYASLVADLQLETLTERPRALGLVSPAENWSRCYGWGEFEARVGLADATKNNRATGRESDAERILAMNPDLIIVFVGDYEGVIRDPRWRGLKAVQNRRVYVSISSNRYTFNLAQPLGSRWMAELAYPDRLQPKLRALFREHYRENYGYSLSEAEVDELLNVAENRNAAGYERFMNPQEPARHEQRHQKPR